MRNILFDIIGNGMINDEIFQVIKDKLLEKYHESFTVTHLGKRFGTESNDTVTAFCRSEINNDIIFTVVLNKDKVHFEDDYIIRKLCYELESKINNDFQTLDIISYSNVKIINMMLYDGSEENLSNFLNNNEDSEFLCRIYIKDDCEEYKFKQVCEKIKQEYNSINCTFLAYILNEKYYDEIVKKNEYLPHSENIILDEKEIKEKYRII